MDIPYELDIYIPKYNLAFEYDGKGWHINNENDKIKNDLCKKNNIKLIRIIENNRNYIIDIKNQLINKIDDINNYCNLDIKKDDILSLNINKIYENITNNLLDINSIKKIILKYTDFTTFRKSELKLYDKLVKMKRLDEFTKDLKRNRIIWNDNNIEKEITKYEYLLDFIQNSQACYLYIKRHKLNDKLDKLKRNNTIWDIDKIKKIILDDNIKTIYMIRKLHSGAYKFIKKNNLVNDIRQYMKNI